MIVRAVAQIEEMGNSRHRIVVSEIPYQVNKSALIERIAELVREGRLNGISDLRDESDRQGLSVVIELKRGAQPRKILNQLYKYTQLQTTFGVQLLALVEGEPRTLSLKRALQVYIEHRRTVITRRSEFELQKARDRKHILDGLLIALANLDDVIETIRKSPDADVAKDRLMQRFKLSEVQAQAILDMQLRRLAALERQKIEEEHKQVLERIGYLEDLLANPHKILALIKEDLHDLAEKFGDARRTHIAHDASGELSEEDLVPDEAVLISITSQGYVKRVLAKTYRQQGRGGRGVQGHSMKDEDEVMLIFPARTLDTVLFFSDRGKVYSEKAYQIPDADRTARGIPMINILALSADESITAAVVVPDFKQADYCTMVTKNGKIKRVELSEFAAVRPSGLIAIGLEEDDYLEWVRLTGGDDDIIIVTERGSALRFHENQVRPMGRPARGVKAIALRKGDFVAGVDVVDPEEQLLVVTRKGFGKRTPLKEYSSKNRATMGVLTLNKHKLALTGEIAAARVVHDEDDLTIISSGGIVLRTKVKQIRSASRATTGVRVIDLREGEIVASVAKTSAKDLKQAGIEIDEGEGDGDTG
jgi:DNA gyrase subunit A